MEYETQRNSLVLPSTETPFLRYRTTFEKSYYKAAAEFDRLRREEGKHDLGAKSNGAGPAPLPPNANTG